MSDSEQQQVSQRSWAVLIHTWVQPEGASPRVPRSLSDGLYLKPRRASSTQRAEVASELQWPENGEVWSDGEEEANMDCGLLQAMAEEDEDINVYNEETFGMGVWTRWFGVPGRHPALNAFSKLILAFL